MIANSKKLIGSNVHLLVSPWYWF